MKSIAFWICVASFCGAAAHAGAGEAGRPAAVPAPDGPPATKSVADWIAELRNPAILRRVCAADTLGAMGAEAKDAVPALIGYLDEKELWVLFAIVDALAAIGEPAVPALGDALRNASDNARYRALQALKRIGPAAVAAEPAIRACIENRHSRIRNLAEEILRSFASPAAADRPAVPAAARPAAADAAGLGTDPGAAATRDWPGFRGPRRDAICTETGLMQQWPEVGPKLLWTIEGLGLGFSSVSIVDGRLFTMGDRPGPDNIKVQCVLAFDLRTRKELWVTPVGPHHKDGPRCTPTVDEGLVFALGTESDLACLDVATGAVRWRSNLAKQHGAKMMTWWKFSESPLVDGDRLVCTPGGPKCAILALHKKTGDVIWTSAAPALGERGADGAGYASMVAADIEGVRQYIQVVGRGVLAVAADTGRFLWGYNRIANDTANIPTPVVRGNYVFVTTSYKAGSALLRIVRDGDAFRAEEAYYLGPEVFENHHGGVVLKGGFVYGGDGQNQGRPVCLHLATGEVAWKPKSPGRGSAAVLYADGHLLFRYDRGEVFWIEADPRAFRVKGRFKAVTGEGPAWAYPVIHDKKLYLRHADILACYELAKSEGMGEK